MNYVVLTLLLLEYGFGAVLGDDFSLPYSLNPSFTGIRFRGDFCSSKHAPLWVLTLLLLEYGFGEKMHWCIVIEWHGLNPSFTGIRFRGSANTKRFNLETS